MWVTNSAHLRGRDATAVSTTKKKRALRFQLPMAKIPKIPNKNA
jgi:hypothetical protein